MADKSDKLIVEALRRAAVDRGGLPPFTQRSAPGLFPKSAAGRSAAQRALAAGWFQVDGDLWAVTEAGMTMLLERTDARQVLEDCVRALEARQGQIADLRATLTRMYGSLDGLRATVEQALPMLATGRTPPDLERVDRAALDAISRWQSDAGEDCPLPELFRQVELTLPGVTIGAFHDSLRRLHAAGRLYLHPWTGPLYECPEPAYALLSGHEVAYYASGRATVNGLNYRDELAAG